MAENTRYFIAKVQSISSLKTCIETSQWACRDRKYPPHPRDILSEALEGGDKVFAIFSVNNCHGWHGYAEILDKPGLSVKTPNNTQEDIDQVGDGKGDNFCNPTETTSGKHDIEDSPSTTNTSHWHYFNVRWVKFFLVDFGERCLSSTETESLTLSDTTPVNKARNWQEVPQETGSKICQLIENCYEKLMKARQDKIKAQEEKLPPAFFKSSDNVDMIDENWKKISKKIQGELGTVILACPFGSQRYNLHTDTSDMDMFIVYQADTCDVLGLSPPKQTIKSSEREECDYTIHEVLRYCELLCSGDHRCVETLFMDEKSVVHGSEALKKLQENRHLFLNKSCLEKYLRDACGNKGTKQFKKWTDEQSGSNVMSAKMCKLAYVIIRLLQNASDIVKGRSLAVYRPNGSPEKELLMRIRNGQISVQETWQHINSLLEFIEEHKQSVTSPSEELSNFMEQWLLSLRYNNFQAKPLKNRNS